MWEGNFFLLSSIVIQLEMDKINMSISYDKQRVEASDLHFEGEMTPLNIIHQSCNQERIYIDSNVNQYGRSTNKGKP